MILTDSTTTFKMSELVVYYKKQLQQLGVKEDVNVHSTRLKERLLSYFPDFIPIKQGRDILLISDNDIGDALLKAKAYDADDDAVHLAKTAKIIRREMLKKSNTFKGSFDSDCQGKSVPVSLVALMSMILDGPSIEDDVTSNQVALTIAQLLMFNCSSRRRSSKEEVKVNPTMRHHIDRETPLPIYIGLMVHAKTRKRDLVDTMFGLGLSISYNRVLDLSTELGNNIYHFYKDENAVCPPKLKKKICSRRQLLIILIITQARPPPRTLFMEQESRYFNKKTSLTKE